MGDVGQLGYLSDVLLKGQNGTVSHDGGAAFPQSLDANLEGAAVIQVGAHGHFGVTGLLDGHLHEMMEAVGGHARSNVQNHRSVEFLSGADGSGDGELIVHVGSGYTVAAFHCTFGDFCHGYIHSLVPPCVYDSF